MTAAQSLQSSDQNLVDGATPGDRLSPMPQADVDAAVRIAILKVVASNHADHEIVVPSDMTAHLAAIHKKDGWAKIGRLHVFVLALLIPSKIGVVAAYNLVPPELRRRSVAIRSLLLNVIAKDPFNIVFPTIH